jgi:hypothetical protein
MRFVEPKRIDIFALEGMMFKLEGIMFKLEGMMFKEEGKKRSTQRVSIFKMKEVSNQIFDKIYDQLRYQMHIQISSQLYDHPIVYIQVKTQMHNQTEVDIKQTHKCVNDQIYCSTQVVKHRWELK